MAKGQKRGNREVRKPKSEKPKALLAPTSTSVTMAFSAGTAKKKK